MFSCRFKNYLETCIRTSDERELVKLLLKAENKEITNYSQLPNESNKVSTIFTRHPTCAKVSINNFYEKSLYIYLNYPRLKPFSLFLMILDIVQFLP